MGPWLRHSGAALAALAGLPIVGATALLRPPWRRGLTQRFGLAGPWAPGSVWVHAASVGEVLAATRLVHGLEARGLPVSASATTPTGFDVLTHLRPTLCSRLAPLDHPWCAGRSMERAAPRALVLIETELWPCWIAAAARRGVPVLVVSARLSSRSLPRYQRLRPLLRPTWSRLAAVGARTEADAERFVSLGIDPARVHTTGDLKFDPPPSVPPLAPELAAFVGDHAPWAAVSTHPDEEDAVLDAFLAARSRNPERRMILAPRHLRRVGELRQRLAARGIEYTLRTAVTPGPEPAPFPAGSVLLLDTLGEVQPLLPAAAFVFVGGTLTPIGGHNVLEPAFAGRAVLFGPHTANVADAARHLRREGAATVVRDAAGLRAAVVEAFDDPDATAKRGTAALRAVNARSGAAERAADLIEAHLRDVPAHP